MEFVGKKCYLCGKKFGNRNPKDVTEVEPFPFGESRIVSVVAPCPSCGEKIPAWAGNEPETELTEPKPEPEKATNFKKKLG